ncbi:MAG: methanogenesis marker 6 protein [Methanosarcinales archaeon]|jgi:putative methanogenesis marker protein 6|nr:methanogenesis marker 6 protein [Methanosarcinales archaeon]
MSSVKKPLSGQKEITKIIAVSSDKVLPADAAQAAYASGYPLTLKETCYGLVLTGTEENVRAVVKLVQDLDKNHIFVKDRGFPTGDPRRCRAVRNGGQRPGFYTLHEEISKMGIIGDALDDYDAGVEKPDAEWPARTRPSQMEEYITAELGKSKKKPEMAHLIADRIAAEKAARTKAKKAPVKTGVTKPSKKDEKPPAAEKTKSNVTAAEIQKSKALAAGKTKSKISGAEKPNKKTAAQKK